MIKPASTCSEQLSEVLVPMQALGQIDGVCSFWEAAQSLVASLAERLGLHAHTPDAVEAAREKQVRCPAECHSIHTQSAWMVIQYAIYS